MNLDVLLPVYNEAQALRPFLELLTAELAKLDVDWLVHLVVDRLTDGTEGLVAELCASQPRLRALLLSTRFGHQEALVAGLHAAREDAAVLMMDSDGQHPPSLIGPMLARLQAGADVVLTRRITNRDQPLLSRALSRAFYGVMSGLSGVPLEAGMADFRLLAPHVAFVLRDGFTEHAPFLRGLLVWLGFETAIVEYDAAARLEGRTKYSLRRRLRMARLAILAFSVGPLRLAAPVGLLVAFVSLLYGAYLAIAWLVGARGLPAGWTTIVVLVSFLGGLQLAFVGVLGEYLANVYAEVKRRPRFVVRKALNYEAGSYRHFG